MSWPALVVFAVCCTVGFAIAGFVTASAGKARRGRWARVTVVLGTTAAAGFVLAAMKAWPA